MENRASRTKTIFLLAAFLAAGVLRAQDPSSRNVSVKVVMDRAIGNPAEWRIAASRLLDDCFASFRKAFGISMTVRKMASWEPEEGRMTLYEALAGLRRKVTPDGCDIVLGFASPERIDSPSLGIASYPYAYVLVKNLPGRESMTYAILHELCHVFGAIDVHEKGSVMGLEEPGFRIDPFTEQAVTLHKARSFDRESFPLPKEALGRGIDFYGRRAGQRLGEPEASLFLALLFMEMGDYESAARACEQAAGEDPGFTGLHVLVGNVCLNRKQTDLAIAEYKKSLEAQPSEPGIHFNLGLAYLQKGMMRKVAEEWRTAVRIDPGFLDARIGLARVFLSEGNFAEAESEGRAALKADAGSAEALAVLGTTIVARLEAGLRHAGARTDAEPAAESDGLPGPRTPAPGVEEAVSLLRKSIALAPDRPESHNALGGAFVLQGRFTEAEAEFLKTLEIQPDDLGAHFGLGRLYLALGAKEKAVFHLKRILDISPTSEMGLRILAAAYNVPRTFPIRDGLAGH